VFVTAALADLHQELEPYYSDIGRPSVDPELMIRMLIVGYCYGIRSERRLTQEVELHLEHVQAFPIPGGIPKSREQWESSVPWGMEGDHGASLQPRLA
jgi:hypothetical protein